MLTSNRDPSKWLGFMADPVLAQSAIDRLPRSSRELVVVGHEVVPCFWQRGGPMGLASDKFHDERDNFQPEDTVFASLDREG